MGDAVPVRCPVCRRTHVYTASAYPCRCGAPVAPPLVRGAPADPITHLTWSDAWVTVRCRACGRQNQSPQPELGCPCGTVLRLPVRPVTAAGTEPDAATATATGSCGPGPAADGPSTSDAATAPGGSAGPGPQPPPAAPVRPPFTPVTIRTARDVVTAAARYLAWLGFRDLVQPEEQRPVLAYGIELRGSGLIAQVDPTTRPVPLRAVECLWLEGLAASSAAVCFSLAGYEPEARARAAGVGLPLFVMDLTGSPQPVNPPAQALVAQGA
ncbi:hypothetical protein I3F58_24640 [Streptomyces sp. MUM 203J]|uniref:hypothetical protein n=1 Tax=Streptomyces sp. MUM 203J TaxID=2791990 RepID=UPI001F04AA3A|nr:hypothetical protein [Streptomyces sp. MUM 203J]MCH0542690.1 hypothetical protein [Streptomyces sp. MUM 203J]